MENEHPDDVLRNLHKKQKEKYKWRKVHHARYTLYVVGSLLILASFFLWKTHFLSVIEADIIIYLMFIFGAIFIGLAIWAKSNPKYALITAILVFVLPSFVNAINNYVLIFEGLWWKSIILFFLIRGLLSAKHITITVIDDDLLDDF